MMRMKGSFKLLLGLFLIASLCLIIVTAEPVAVYITPINDDISQYDEAQFNISISNLFDITDDFTIYSPNVDGWTFKFNPDGLRLSPQETGYVVAKIRPKASVIPGIEYGVQLNIRSAKNGALSPVYAYINVKSQEQINDEYAPVLTIDAPEIGSFDPTESMTYIITLENKNIRDVQGLVVNLQADEFSQSVTVDLEPLKKKSILFTIKTSPQVFPARDSAIVAVSYQGQMLLSRSVNYEIKGIERFERSVIVKKAFLRQVHAVSVINTGNLPTLADYNIPTNFANYFFISGKYKSRLVSEDGSWYKQYSTLLQPGESSEMELSVSYVPVLYILFITITSILLYFLFRSPLIIHKSVSSISASDGSISELKVLLHIKNRSGKQFEHLITLDRLPNITEIKEGFELGSIKPSSIMTNPAKGTILRWDIAAIDGYEERVITYSLTSKMSIIGGMTLPIAIVKYRKDQSSKEQLVRSNTIKLVLSNYSGTINNDTL